MLVNLPFLFARSRLKGRKIHTKKGKKEPRLDMGGHVRLGIRKASNWMSCVLPNHVERIILSLYNACICLYTAGAVVMNTPLRVKLYSNLVTLTKISLYHYVRLQANRHHHKHVDIRACLVISS
jgi:hypothetical protein